MKVLLACANCIAQDRGHRLHRQDSATAARGSFDSLAEQEVRKRIWCFLCIQDWYLIGSRGSYSISPSHCTTALPANCREDDDDADEHGSFLDLPLSTQTQSTYMLFLHKSTSIYRALHDRLCLIETQKGPISECFDEVLSTDSQVEKLITEMSDLQRNHNSWQRRAMTTVMWHLRLVIHRSFFCRSFQDKRYYYSRAVSLNAAHKILCAYQDSSAQQEVEIWTIPTHAISSCIIITLNALFSTESDAFGDNDMELMDKCLASLKVSRRPNKIAERGIEIIEYLLSQRSQLRFKKLDFNEVSQLAGEISSQGGPSSQANDSPDSNSGVRRQDDVAMEAGIFDPIGHLAQDEFFSSYLFDPFIQDCT